MELLQVIFFKNWWRKAWKHHSGPCMMLAHWGWNLSVPHRNHIHLKQCIFACSSSFFSIGGPGQEEVCWVCFSSSGSHRGFRDPEYHSRIYHTAFSHDNSSTCSSWASSIDPQCFSTHPPLPAAPNLPHSFPFFSFCKVLGDLLMQNGAGEAGALPKHRPWDRLEQKKNDQKWEQWCLIKWKASRTSETKDTRSISSCYTCRTGNEPVFQVCCCNSRDTDFLCVFQLSTTESTVYGQLHIFRLIIRKFLKHAVAFL